MMRMVLRICAGQLPSPAFGQPTALVVVLDPPSGTCGAEKNLRREVYDRYKVHRPERPSDIDDVLRTLPSVLRQLGVNTLALRCFGARFSA